MAPDDSTPAATEAEISGHQSFNFDQSNMHVAAYFLFLMELSRVRASLTNLLTLASESRPQTSQEDAGAIGTAQDLAVSILALAAGIMQAHAGDVVAHNCVGASLQIIYSVFEAFVSTLGLTPGHEIRSGREIGGEPLSRILWAGRSAFGHTDEWRNKGDKGHPNALHAQTILKNLGFADPLNINLYDLYKLISGGSIEAFLDDIRRMAGDLAKARKTFVPKASSVIVIQQLLAPIFAATFMTIAARAMQMQPRGDGEGPNCQIIIGIPSGEEMLFVPVADGRILHPIDFATAMRLAAIKRLSAGAAEPFAVFDDRFASWLSAFKKEVYGDANFTELEKQIFDAPPTFHDKVSSLGREASELYRMHRVLPNPVTALAKERGISELREFQQFLVELLEDSGYKGLPYSEIRRPLDSLPASLVSFPPGKDVAPPSATADRDPAGGSRVTDG